MAETLADAGTQEEALEPFTGLIILDASQGIAGPYCAAILGMQGAAVYKVEPPAGDWGRHIGANLEGLSAISTSSNGGKLSVCIDATLPDGNDLMTRLAKKADVVIESFRPGVAARVGLDPQVLRQARPDQIILSVSGFGDHGPGAKRPGSDTVLQALSGMMQLNAAADSTPRLVPMYLIDTATALYASQLLTSALLQRELTGKGRHLKVSLLEAAAAFQMVPQLESALRTHLPAGNPPVPSGVFETKEGFIRLTTLTQRNFESLCKGLNCAEWLENPDFATNEARLNHIAEMTDAVARAVLTKSAQEWLAILEPLGVLCAPVNDYQAFRDDPQVQAMQIFDNVQQPGLGTVPLPKHPGLQAKPQPAPKLGEHSRQVLQLLGISDPEVESLIAAGVVRLAEDTNKQTS